MPAPNRASDVAAICERHPEAFPTTDQNDAARLVLLRGVIIPTLNVADGGRWGYLTKTDQPLGDGTFKVPCDVLMDRVSGWTVDCMTGDGACWIDHEPPPPAWIWTAVPAVGVPVVVAADLSVPVVFAPVVAPVIVGTIVPQPDGSVVLIDGAGRVLSPQPNGTIAWRTTVGGWERAIRVGHDVLRYDGTGTTFFVLVATRDLA